MLPTQAERNQTDDRMAFAVWMMCADSGRPPPAPRRLSETKTPAEKAMPMPAMKFCEAALDRLKDRIVIIDFWGAGKGDIGLGDTVGVWWKS